MSYCNMSMHIFIKELHQFTRIETILLSKIDKQFTITLAGWWCCLLAFLTALRFLRFIL